ERWNDPVFVAAAKIRSSEEMKKRFACPAYRDRHSEIRSRHMKEQRKDAAFNAICNEAASRRNKRPVYCVSLDRYFGSGADAAAPLGVSVLQINKQFRGMRTSTGWEWRYWTESELIAGGYEPSKVRRDMPTNRKVASGTKKEKPVLCPEINMAFPSAKAASAAFGEEKSSAIVSAISKGGTAFGYSWRYITLDDMKNWGAADGFGSLKHLRKDPRKCPVLCVETGKVYGST